MLQLERLIRPEANVKRLTFCLDPSVPAEIELGYELQNQPDFLQCLRQDGQTAR